MRSSCKAFSQLVINGRVQPTLGGAIPGLVVLGSLRKQAEQAMGSISQVDYPPAPPPAAYILVMVFCCSLETLTQQESAGRLYP